MDVTLHAEDISFGYGRRPILRNVTLPPVRAGDVTAVIGPNAAGKSTLLHCIAGLRRSTGTVRLGGPSSPRRLRDRVLYLPQDPPPRTSITVFSAVQLADRLGGHQDRKGSDERVARTLSELNLEHLAVRRMSDLSGGQRQLVALGQSIVRDPDVLLLDEPTSSLDLRNQLQVLQVVRNIAQQRSTAVLTIVHDLNLVSRMADRVVVLHAGQVYAHGRPDEVITRRMLRDVYEVEGEVQHGPNDTVSVMVTSSL